MGARLVLDEVPQHVHQGVSHLTWCRQRPRVVSVRKDTPAPPEYAVHGAGDSHLEALDAPNQSLATVRLGEQMDVIALDGEVNQAKVLMGRSTQRVPNGRKEPREAQVRQTPSDPQGYVRGVLRIVDRSSTVEHDCTWAGLATCAASTATPGVRYG